MSSTDRHYCSAKREGRWGQPHIVLLVLSAARRQQRLDAALVPIRCRQDDRCVAVLRGMGGGAAARCETADEWGLNEQWAKATGVGLGLLGLQRRCGSNLEMGAEMGSRLQTTYHNKRIRVGRRECGYYTEDTGLAIRSEFTDTFSENGNNNICSFISGNWTEGLTKTQQSRVESTILT